jgi:hypothetical protein
MPNTINLPFDADRWELTREIPARGGLENWTVRYSI